MTTTISGTMRLFIKVVAGIALALGLCMFATSQLAFAEGSLTGGSAAGDLSAQAETQPDNTFTTAEKTPHVTYRGHVQDEGWQDTKKDGQTAGTVGKRLRLEAFQVSLTDKPYVGSVKYRAYVQKSGWQNWVENGVTAGTTGKALRIEALQVKLTSKMAKKYDVYYRVQVEDIGWMDWAKNGDSAGTIGLDKQVEALQIKLVKKGGAAPGKTDKPFETTYLVNYSVYVQTLGWKKDYKDGAQAGTTGAGLRLEAFAASVADMGIEGNIIYSAHIANQGWCNWRANGETVGAANSNRAIEALQIDLSGDLAKKFDVYYRVHSQNFGWLGWAKNSTIAGTVGYGYRAEAVQVQLVKKGGKAPGSTEKPSHVK